ncbi:MAG: c-type cytochrome [Gammaproteobacteria bacterium]|nr:c-type cytochrome [Gammaproteobacteria bacterium]
MKLIAQFSLVLVFSVGVLVAAMALPSHVVQEGMQSAPMVEAGRRMTMPCMSCHGANGDASEGKYPKLAGQNAEYLVAAMRAYRDGRRDSSEMRVFMAQLADEEIDAIAAFYAAQAPR